MSDRRAARTWADIPEETIATRVMLITAASVTAIFSIYTSYQSSMVYGAHSQAIRGVAPEPGWEFLVRTAVNLSTLAVIVLLVLWWHPERRRGLLLVAMVVGISVIASLLRGVLQLAAGIYDLALPVGVSATVSELFSTAVFGVAILTASLLHQWLWRRLHRAERVRLDAQRHVTGLLRDLQDEELRVRQEVAQTLHGTVQTVFVVLESQLRAIAQRVDPPDGDQLLGIAGHLDRLRESELRTLSSALYPQDLERGLSAAVATLVARIPSSVAVTADFAAACDRLDGERMDLATRVLVVRIVEEGISNALRHGHARALDLRVSYDGAEIEIVVDQDGTPPADGHRPSGLARLQQYLDLHDGAVTLTDGGRFGTGRLRATLRFPGDDAAGRPRPDVEVRRTPVPGRAGDVRSNGD